MNIIKTAAANSTVIADAPGLLAYCKDNGVMLLANVSETSSTPEGIQRKFELVGSEGRAQGNVFTLGEGIEINAFRPYEAVAPGEFLQEEVYNNLAGKPCGFIISQDLLGELNNSINDESSEYRKIASVTIDRSFVYVDISDFSKFPPAHQALVINSLIQLVRRQQKRHEGIEAMLCIGDGYIFVFKSPLDAAIFAGELANTIQGGVAIRAFPVEFHFRMSVHCGPVFSFWDIGRTAWNYIGDGINGGQRVLAAIGKEVDDVVFISEEIAQRLRSSKARECRIVLNNVENKGRRQDKHGRPWRVYQLNHVRLGSELTDTVEQERRTIEQKRRDRELDRKIDQAGRVQ